ncbi:helix-turn-helix transcriptional regulator [Aurantiacibacter aquimixticola]|uniref:Helix-turn-helix transcriptional regulator n=1 Tax=Aurantiacibacter aquimixticola TaxID=1958945 RepID=A0A419RU42_9SPHN|nr:helix-turn-helix transcriptional regulator [Aurantiacibacter aquimixticola]RJY09308.1 helix-turn-helix transcriptional regulator [Aurantiacibacter aquimixticola]
MRVPNLGETELLVPLHDGVFEQPMWQTFLARLRQVAGASGATMLIRSGEGEAVQFGSGRAPPAITEDLREGRVYSGDELEIGASSLRAMRVATGDGLQATIILTADNSFGADIASLLSALAPHFKVALRVLETMERERARSEVSAEAFARINFGWISLDAKSRIVDHDPQAGRMLSQSSTLRRGHYDRLTPSDPAVDRQLTALVRSFATDPRARPRAINLSHDPWIDILVAPLRLEALAGGTDAVAVVYIRGDRSSSETRAEQLVDLFDLTPSEARLAWSMAQGLSIAEAAEEHGLTIETARNYSKKIYAKTGARGQVDLVRHVLTGVLALA